MSSLGKLSRVQRQWAIEAEPHIVLKAKRVFQNLQGKRNTELRLSDTIENCRELAWFLERYPLEMTADDEAYLKSREAMHRERETVVARILAGQVELAPVDTALPLRDYQRQAVELFYRQQGLLLADDMGLGKTAQAIGAMTDPRLRPCVVITKTALPKQWEAEIRKFAPKLTTHIVTKGTPYDVTEVARGRRKKSVQMQLPGLVPDVIIISWSKLANWAGTLGRICRSVVYDEIQEIRHGHKSAKGQAAFELSAAVDFRLGLTGTPIFNLGHEMFPVVEAVRPGVLGTRAEFLAEHCGSEDSHGRAALRDPKAFGTYLRREGIMLRRNREDVGLSKTEVTRNIVPVDADDKPLKDVESAAENLAQVILGRVGATNHERMQAASELDLKLRMATGVAKAPYVAEFVKLLLENDEPVLLFGWHRDVYNIWLDRLKHYNPVLYTGSESVAQKNAAKDAFCSGKSKLLIMSLRSGEGIDGLQNVCRTVVYGELDWSPAVIEQDNARIDRPGQERGVNVFFLLADHGSDPPMADVLNLKRSQLEGIREPTKDVIVRYEADGQRVKELARQFLESRREKRAP